MTAGVAAQSVGVLMEAEGEETVRAEGLPAALFTDGHGGGTATIMENESLVVILEVFGDIS